MFVYNNEKRLDFYSHILLLFVFGPSINYFLNYLIQVVFGINISLSIVFYLIISALGVFCLFKSVSQKPHLVFVLFLFLFLCLLSYFLYPEVASSVFSNIFNPVYSKPYVLFVYCLPASFFAYVYWNAISDYTKKNLWKYAFVCQSLGLIAYFFFVRDSLIMEYMTFSYNLLASTVSCFAYVKYSDTKRTPFLIIFSILLGLAGLFCIVFSGARGAMLSAVAGLIVLVFSGENTSIKRLMAFCASMISSTIIFVYFNAIVKWFVKLSSDLGIKKIRTLEKILSHSLFTDEGRMMRQQAVFKGLMNNPFGYGFFGDYHCIYLSSGTPSYVHNIVLELFADFGVFLGTFFIVFCVYHILRAVISNNAFFAVIILPNGLFQLLFSGSFLSEISAFILFGYLMALRKERKQAHVGSLAFQLRGANENSYSKH